MITVELSQRIFQLIHLKTVCAWCHLTICEGEPGPVSHGLCDACAALLESGR